MIEKIVKDYIQEKLNIPCLLEEDPTIEEYVLIRKSGSAGDRFIETAFFTMHSYARSLFNAAMLNESLKKCMEDMPGIVNTVSKVDLNSDGNWTDPKTKRYRYQAIFEITYHR